MTILRRKLASAAILAVAATSAFVGTAAAADTVLQGEAMRLSAAEATVIKDSAASGGKALAMWWSVDASAIATTTSASGGLSLRARGDQYLGAPTMTVYVDGVKAASVAVSSTSWKTYKIAGKWAAGRRAVKISYREGAYGGSGKDQNLYLDSVTFTGATTPTPTPPPTPTPTPTPDPAPAGQTITAFVTGYTRGDNDPPGSAAIAYPSTSDPRTLHREASGTGTYDDPITIAVGKGAFTPGTRMYVPHVKRYFIVEDLCASCLDREPTKWVDLWISGPGQESESAAQACAGRITGNYAVEVNPPRGRAVVVGPLLQKNVCTL